MNELNDYKQRILKRIAVHHSSLMKFTKELMEQLFNNGGIKVIFPTKTLAVVLNAPTKSVLFTSLQKFNGEKKRRCEKSEFVRMAKRAGRRGVDNKSVIIFSVSENLESQMKVSYQNIFFYASKNNIDGLKNTLELSFLKYKKRTLNSKIAIIKKLKKVLVAGNFLNENNKKTAKGSIAFSARFNSNYLAIGQMLNNKVFMFKEEEEVFIESDNSDGETFYKEIVNEYCERIYRYEFEYGVVGKDTSYKLPVITTYITAIKEIYKGIPIHEVTKTNNMYCGVLCKKVREMRHFLEQSPKTKILMNFTKKHSKISLILSLALKKKMYHCNASRETYK
uniref:Integrase catalytic domain-containing protein n=1 Tax=Strongyloides stercoralis TaxID=6248 RepID=A0AAF5DIY6_STRER